MAAERCFLRRAQEKYADIIKSNFSPHGKQFNGWSNHHESSVGGKDRRFSFCSPGAEHGQRLAHVLQAAFASGGCTGWQTANLPVDTRATMERTPVYRKGWDLVDQRHRLASASVIKENTVF